MTTVMRILRAVAAVLLIAAIVVGGAWALVRFGRLWELWTITWSEILVRPDDGGLLLAVITLIGWIAWTLVTLSFVSEALAAFTQQRRRLRFPGSELLAPLTAVLIAAIAGLVASGVAAAPAAQGGVAPQELDLRGVPALAEALPVQAPGDSASQTVDAQTQMHLVQPGDDLWSLAERYYGDGAKWRQIAAANHTSLLVSTDHLEPGMMLAIPDADSGSSASTVVVQSDQTLSHVAAEYLGDAGRWPELVAANPEVITDPDVIDAGWRLRLPDPAEAAASGVDDAGLSAGIDRGDQAAQSSPEHSPEDQSVPEHSSDDRSSPEHSPDDQSVPEGSPDYQSPLDLQSCPIPERSDSPGGSLEPQMPADGQSESDRPPLQAGIAALGAAATAILASTFVLRRRQQLAKRPIGHAVPELGPDARRASIALGHAASTMPSPVRAAGQEVADHQSTADHQDLVYDQDAAHQATMTRPVEQQIGGRSRTEIVIGLLSDSIPEQPDRELYYDVEREQVTWLHGHPDLAAGMAAAMALALAASGANQVVVAGSSFDWLVNFDDSRVEVRSDIEQACRWLDGLAARRAANRDADSSLDQLRADPLVSEAWSPVVLIVDAMPARLPRRFSGLGLSMIVCAGDVPPADGASAIRVTADRAVCLSTALIFVPHLVSGPARRVLGEIFEVASATDYPVAPWWATYETAGLPIMLPTVIRSGSVEGGTVSPTASTEHPVVKLLGTIELVGARGTPPPRAIRQCVEYCAWLLENPGGTAAMMSDELMVAEATRRSNMSRLRSWLGSDEHGAAYLPDAYSGHISLHPGITSDWELLQSLIGGGVNRVASASLVHALELVRGTPLADAAPGQWHWAEQLRHNMVATICDIAVVLARRALKAGDLDSAQWAVERGLAAGSEDEHLAAVQIQLAHVQHDDALVDQLVMQLTRRTRVLGIDLSDETVTLLQEVVEGRARLRQA